MDKNLSEMEKYLEEILGKARSASKIDEAMDEYDQAVKDRGISGWKPSDTDLIESRPRHMMRRANTELGFKKYHLVGLLGPVESTVIGPMLMTELKKFSIIIADVGLIEVFPGKQYGLSYLAVALHNETPWLSHMAQHSLSRPLGELIKYILAAILADVENNMHHKELRPLICDGYIPKLRDYAMRSSRLRNFNEGFDDDDEDEDE